MRETAPRWRSLPDPQPGRAAVPTPSDRTCPAGPPGRTGETEQTRRLCRAGAQHIDPDPALLEIERPMTSKAAQGGFGCAVEAEGRHRDDAGGRAGKEDGGAVDQQRQRLLHGEQHTLHFPAERTVILLFGDAPERQVRSAAGIGEQDVDPAGVGFHLRVQPIQVGHFRGVGQYACRVPADAGDRLVEFGLTAPGDEHARPFRCKALRAGEADPCRAAGNDGDFFCESASHDVSPDGWDTCARADHSKIEDPENHRCRIADVQASRFRRVGDVRESGGGTVLCRRRPQHGGFRRHGISDDIAPRGLRLGGWR